MPTIPSVLEAVTIYREGALCVRAAETGSGGLEVRVGGLPLALDPTSLRASVRAGTARVQDVRAALDVQIGEELDVPAEQRALEEAEDALGRLELRHRRLSTELEELGSLRPTFLEHRKGDPPREAAVLPMVALADFADAELARRLDEQRQLLEELDDARRERQLRVARLAEASTARRTERARVERVAVVTLAAPPEGRLVLTVEYRVPGVRWVPSYQLTLDRALGHGSLTMRASVAQATGEDWKGVRLGLSTASLDRRTDVPELLALKIGRRQEAPPRSGWRAPPPGLDALFEGYDGALASRPRPSVSLPPLPPPPPAPASRRSAAPGGEVLFGAEARSRRAAPPEAEPMKAMSAAPPPSASLASWSGGARAKGAALREEEQDMAMFDLAVDAAPEEAPLHGAPPVASGLDAALRDYARLAMCGPREGGHRGQLRPASDDQGPRGVEAAVARAVAAAGAPEGLALPSGTQPAAPVASFDYRYDCTSPADIASTGRWVTVPVAACAVKLTPQYVVVPAVDPAVYRTLQLGNLSPMALLPGPVDVMAGDTFLLTSSLPAVPPGAQALHRLGLGVEEGIKVARRTTHKETPGGFLGGSTVLPHEVEVEVANRLGSAIPIEVRERVPFVNPEHEKEVKVEETAVSPAWEVVKEPLDGGEVVRGARRWRLTVGAGETVKLKAQYAIRIPSDSMLVGGNRRA